MVFLSFFIAVLLLFENLREFDLKLNFSIFSNIFLITSQIYLPLKNLVLTTTLILCCLGCRPRKKIIY